jgi:hypothetical protein
MLRAMAIQCASEKPVVDIVLPVILHDKESPQDLENSKVPKDAKHPGDSKIPWGAKLQESCMSAILISVTNRHTESPIPSVAIDQAEIPFFPKKPKKDAKNEGPKRPYIAIVMELGIPPSLLDSSSATDDEDGTRTSTSDEAETSTYEETDDEPSEFERTEQESPPSEASAKQLKTAVSSTPSKVITDSTVGQRSARKTSTKHPRYSIYAYGCSKTVYLLIEDTGLYARLLESLSPEAELSKRQPRSVRALNNMKQTWAVGEECYGFVDEPTLHESRLESKEQKEGVEVGKAAAGQRRRKTT